MRYMVSGFLPSIDICLAFYFLFLMYICFFPACYSSASMAMCHTTMYDDALYRAIPWWKTWDLALPLKIEHLQFVLTIWEPQYGNFDFRPINHSLHAYLSSDLIEM